MAILLNRKYGSRLECLYYILKSRYQKYGKNSFFSLSDIKYDDNDPYNVHNYCSLLIDCVEKKCCPFLQNPLNISKCYATQSVESDSTKSKAVSDIGGSLEALGFITRTGNKYRISDSGEQWALSSFDSKAWHDIALKGVLSYGVVVGFIKKILQFDDKFSTNDIYLSYPKTREYGEYVDEQGQKKVINLSSDSQQDSNTRTVTRVIAWCITVGLIVPVIENYIDIQLPQLAYRQFSNKPELTVRFFKKTELCNSLFKTKFFVNNPLAYSRLHKNVGSLRENGGKALREITLKFNSLILNRRFTIVYILNKYSIKDKKVAFSKLVSAMEQYKNFYFPPGNSAMDIMQSEIEIADIAGIPFDVDGDYLIPLTRINENVLCDKVDKKLLDLVNNVINYMELS